MVSLHMHFLALLRANKESGLSGELYILGSGRKYNLIRSWDGNCGVEELDEDMCSEVIEGF